MTRIAKLLLLSVLLLGVSAGLSAQGTPAEAPVRRTISFGGVEREYFVWIPPRYERQKPYWPLVVVHGAGGQGRNFFMATGIAGIVAARGFDAIVISPSFRNDDGLTSRFPVLGEGAFLEAVLADVRRDYAIRPKMLLTGYSRGGQFAHRFALTRPELVHAVAPFASGSWTTPDGRLLVEEIGEVPDAGRFLSDPVNASKVPVRFRDMFETRVAAVASTKAAAASRAIPFLVMCGTLDSMRLKIAREFAKSLATQGYRVETEWPLTPHACPTESCRAEHGAEFAKYFRSAADFFQRSVASGERERKF